MSITLTASGFAVLCILVILIRRVRASREIERHSISPEALHTLLASKPDVLVFDVRQPLDLLAESEIIPGATRLAPKDVIEDPSLIPRDQDTVVYCTCPSDKTSRAILHHALDVHHYRIKFLKHGLAGWKAQGYPVEPYLKPFHLDTGT